MSEKEQVARGEGRIEFPFSKTEQLLVQTALAEEQVLAFPTETFYGLGGNALSPKVVERVFQIKGRSRNKPLSVLANPEWLPRLCQWETPKVEALMDAFWPGPLTLILPVHPQLPEHLRGPDGTLAVRYSSNSAVQSLLELGDCPIIGTSANRTDWPECSTADAVLKQLGSRLDIIIDGGKTSGLQASTIVHCVTIPFRIVRQGVLPVYELNQICRIL